MKVFNPTEKEISITYKGVEYTAPANDFASPTPTEEAATYWKNMIHEFVQVTEDEYVEPKKEKVKEVVEEEVVTKK